MRVFILLAVFATASFPQTAQKSPNQNAAQPQSKVTAPGVSQTAVKPPADATAVAKKTVSPKPLSNSPKPLPPAPEEVRSDLLLATALGDKNPDVRKEAVAALGLVGPREPYLSALSTALADKDVYVRLAAVASLVDLKHKDAVPLLVKALDDETPEVSFTAAKALWTLGDPRGREALVAVLTGEAKTTSGAINSQKRDMMRMFHTPRTLMLFAFKKGIGLVPFPGVGEGVSSLTLLLTDSGVSGRAATVILLAEDKSSEVTAALRDALEDKDASVRAAAVHAIALRDNATLMNDLVPLLDDAKEPVRVRAAAGYLRLAWIKTHPQPYEALHRTSASAASAAPVKSIPAKTPASGAGISK